MLCSPIPPPAVLPGSSANSSTVCFFCSFVCCSACSCAFCAAISCARASCSNRTYSGYIFLNTGRDLTILPTSNSNNPKLSACEPTYPGAVKTTLPLFCAIIFSTFFCAATSLADLTLASFSLSSSAFSKYFLAEIFPLLISASLKFFFLSCSVVSPCNIIIVSVLGATPSSCANVMAFCRTSWVNGFAASALASCICFTCTLSHSRVASLNFFWRDVLRVFSVFLSLSLRIFCFNVLISRSILSCASVSGILSGLVVLYGAALLRTSFCIFIAALVLASSVFFLSSSVSIFLDLFCIALCSLIIFCSITASS